MPTLVTANGHEVLVDDADLHLVAALRWSAYEIGRDCWYAMSEISGRRVYMHRFVTGAPKGLDVDHRNGNGLDNRRENLRVVPHRLNLANQRIQSRPKSSRFKGVSRTKAGAWESYIKVDGRRRHLGNFRDEVEAAKAYDRAALEAWGEFARPNFGA